MSLGDGLHERQAQARAFVIVVLARQAKKWLKNAVSLSLGHAWAAICHGDAHLRCIELGQGDLHAVKPTPVAHGVVNQIAQQAANESWHAHDFDGLGQGTQFQLHARARALFAGQARQIDLLNGTEVHGFGVQSGGQKNFIDQLVKLSDVLFDLGHSSGVLRLGHQLQTHANASEGGSQFMRGIGQQGFVRQDQRLDLGGSVVKALRKKPNFVLARLCHPCRKVALTPLLNTGLQGFQATRQSTHDGVGGQSDGDGHPGEQPNEAQGLKKSIPLG